MSLPFAMQYSAAQSVHPKHFLFTTESEEEQVYSRFDVTIYFACMFTKSHCNVNTFVTSNQE